MSIIMEFQIGVVVPNNFMLNLEDKTLNLGCFPVIIGSITRNEIRYNYIYPLQLMLNIHKYVYPSHVMDDDIRNKQWYEKK